MELKLNLKSHRLHHQASQPNHTLYKTQEGKKICLANINHKKGVAMLMRQVDFKTKDTNRNKEGHLE